MRVTVDVIVGVTSDNLVGIRSSDDNGLRRRGGVRVALFKVSINARLL